MNRTATAIVIVACLGVAAAMAAPADSTGTPGFRIEDEPTCAVGAAFRTALIPFDSEERTVATFIPFVFYDGRGPFYFRGLEGGVRLWRPGDWQFSAMTRIRFFDIPQDLQNQIQGDTFFYGLQARYAPFGPWHLDLEVLGLEAISALLAGGGIVIAGGGGGVPVLRRPDGRLEHSEWHERHDFLPLVDILKLDVVEAEALTGEREIQTAARAAAARRPG